MIDLKDASFFIRLCETENITKAAILCNVSPSTLSRTISKLENDLGFLLCTRDQKGINITPQGLAFAEFARETLKSYQNLKFNFNKEINELSGKVKIYCSVTASYIFIPRFLNEISLSMPSVELSLQTGDVANALDKLKDKEFNFVIAPIDEENLSPEIEFVHLATFPLIFIAPANNIGNIDVNINEMPFIMSSHGLLNKKANEYFKKIDKFPSKIVNVEGHEAIVCMTALGYGVSLIPNLVAYLSPFKNDLHIKRDEDFGFFKVGLCYRKDNLTELDKACIEMAKSVAPSFSSELSRKKNIVF